MSLYIPGKAHGSLRLTERSADDKAVLFLDSVVERLG